MQNVPNVAETLRTSHAVEASVRVIAEWNQNRYAPISVIDNDISPEATNGADLMLFPIASIADTVRPTNGIIYGRTNEGVVTSGYGDAVSGARYYTSDPDQKYKYWTSQTPSTSTGALVNCRPYIKYAAPLWTNKIYFCFENSWATPTQYNIQVSIDGTNYTTVASHISPQADGSVSIYRQANGSWGTAVNRDSPMQIRGVRLVVTTLNRANAYFNLIELSPRLESDLSSNVISYDVDNEMSDTDFISPIGAISSNTGSVTLSNIDLNGNLGLFDNDNTGSIYYDIIDANVKFTIDIGIKTGANFEYVRQATMFSETWGGQEAEIVVPLKDASKFLQEIKPVALLLEDVTIGQAIWRILDSVGFNYYRYSKAADQTTSTIGYLWTNPEKTVWEQIQDICRTTQSAAYFDEFGILQIKTRESAFNKSAAVAWTVRGDAEGTSLPDMEEIEVGAAYEANKVTISYKPTELAQDEFGRPLMETVWQAEGSTVLRSASLRYDMTSSQMDFTMDREDAVTWPFSGIANIHGELVRYEGKEYRYMDKNNSWKTVVLTSNDHKLQVDRDLSSTTQYYRNYYTGKFIVVERGYDVTTAQPHDTNIRNWRWGYYGDTVIHFWLGGIKHLPAQSVMRLQTNSNFKESYFFCARRGNSVDPGNKFFGTRIKFPTAGRGTEMTAGMFFWASENTSSMYGVEITATEELNEKGRRQTMNEIRLIKRTGGSFKTIAGSGAAMVIARDKWYDIDVMVEDSGLIKVFINGRLAHKGSDPDATKLTRTNYAGLYVRGWTVADFEYYYSAMDVPVMDDELDNSSFLDIVRGGYHSNQGYQNFAYRTREVKVRRGAKTTTQKQKYAARLWDEFGIDIHEVRPMEIAFEKTPVLYSSLYMTNTDQAVIDEYVGNPFGAKFIIANAARWNAVVNGEDTITFGADNPVDQKLLILGRTIQQKEDETYEVKNEQAIRARGEIPIEISSDWIQSEGAAKALGDWIVNNWSEPSDQLQVSIFGNPLLQISDVVAIHHPAKRMAASTHKYFVTAVNHAYDGGLTTTLSLRRVRI